MRIDQAGGPRKVLCRPTPARVRQEGFESPVGRDEGPRPVYGRGTRDQEVTVRRSSGQSIALGVSVFFAVGVIAVLIWKTLVLIGLILVVLACWRYYRDDARARYRPRGRHRARRARRLWS